MKRTSPSTHTAADRPDAGAAVSAPRGSAVMAAGSVVSRATGFARSAVVAAALGTIGPSADGYAVGNALPTIVYMLLLGGALNAVFVPELVRAAKEHPDAGAAYTDRLVTVCVVALLVITATAVWAAPTIVDVYTDYTGSTGGHDHRAGPLLPAPDLLPRTVHAARPDTQCTGPVRRDDVGMRL